MKKFLKIFLFIALIVILGIEVYFYFFARNGNQNEIKDSSSNVTKKEKATNYEVDLYSGYNKDNLTYTDNKESEHISYKTISGLKNKKIEDEINKKIKDKVDKLKKDLPSNYLISTNINSNFENTLSIGFCRQEKIYENCSIGEQKAALNFDLTTGKELKLEDIVNSKDNFKQNVLDKSYEDFSKYVGIVCEGGPCEHSNPDYSVVEDEVFQIASKYNKGEYYFTYNPEYIYITFNNVKIKDVEYCYENKEGCYEIKIDGTSETIPVRDNYLNTYTAKIRLVDFYDNLAIYDKFKTDNSIYEKESTKIKRKFTLSDQSIYSDSEMIETDNYLVDYDLITYETKRVDKAKNSLLKEMVSSNKDKFTIYNVFGEDRYLIANNKYNYVYYDVLKYELDKNKYKDSKKQIYLDKYNKIDTTEEPIYAYEKPSYEYKTYSYLKDNFVKKQFYYYLFDKDGNEIDSSDILNKDYLSIVIPNEWYSLGSDKTIDDMVKNSLLMHDEKYSYPNNLVIYDLGNRIKLKYKNKEISLCDDYETYGDIENMLFK